jgi:AP-1 complex subunit beta-1
MSEFAIQFNVNSYGFVPSTLNVPVVEPGQSVQVSLGLQRTGEATVMEPVNMLQIAVKNNVGVYYFATMVPLALV